MSALSIRLDDHGDRLAAAFGADRPNGGHGEPELVPKLIMVTGTGRVPRLVPVEDLEAIEGELGGVVAAPIRSFRDRGRARQILGHDRYRSCRERR